VQRAFPALGHHRAISRARGRGASCRLGPLGIRDASNGQTSHSSQYESN
jgi:hypothetical protein